MQTRTAWRPAGLAALLIICGCVMHPRLANGADPGPAVSAGISPGISPPSEDDTASQPAPAPTGLVLLPEMSSAWFLNRIRRLVHEGRTAEADQIAWAAVALYPDATGLRLGAAFAAMRSGRCDAATAHLDVLRGVALAAVQQRKADLVRAICVGPWRWQALFGTVTGYRPSLVDRQRDVEIRPQPGSRLHGLCVRLASLCNPDRPLESYGQRDSSIDLWLNLTIRQLYRRGGDWDLDLDTILFQRRPRRPGFAGNGAILRLAATYGNGTRRSVRIGAEVGRTQFQQGRPDLAILQRHRQVNVGLSFAHRAGLQSDFAVSHLAVRSQWLDLAQRRYEYGLARNLSEALTLSLVGAREISRQKGAGMMPGSRAGEVGMGLRWTGDRFAARLHHRHRHETFRGRLPFLAASHRAKTRTTRVDVMTPDTPGDRSGTGLGAGSGWLNLKVVVSFEYRKISTPDPFRLPAGKTLMLRVSREIFASH